MAAPNCAGVSGKMPCGVIQMESGRGGSFAGVQTVVVVACETWFPAALSAHATLPITRVAARVATIMRIVMLWPFALARTGTLSIVELYGDSGFREAIITSIAPLEVP